VGKANDFSGPSWDDVPVAEGNPMAGDRRSKHCYAGKAALCWEIGLTKDKEPTVFLQGCPAIGEKVYDWKKKITLQLSIHEMFQVVNVLTHARKAFKAGNHGQNNDKAFEILDQSDNGTGKYYVKVMQAKSADGKLGGMFAVPVTEADAIEVLDLVVGQLQKRLYGAKTAMDVINMARMIIPKA